MSRTEMRPAASEARDLELHDESAGLLHVEVSGDGAKQMGSWVRAAIVRTIEFSRARAAGTVLESPSPSGTTLVFMGADLGAPLRCATQVVEGIEAGLRTRLRMAAHAGPVTRRMEESTTTAVGPGVDRVRSLCARAAGGEVLVSDDLARAVANDPRWVGMMGPVAATGARVLLVSELLRRSQPFGAVAPTVSALTAVHETPREAVPSIASKAPGSDGIPTRWLAVSHSRTSRGSDLLIYAPERQDTGDGTCAPVFVDINETALQGALDSLRRRVDELTRLALQGQPRGSLGIEDVAATVARHALPREGVLSLVGRGVHPQLQLLQDIAARIPWEALEENQFCCAECGETRASFVEGQERPFFCSRCGRAMSRSGGKLAIATYLSHVVAGQRAPVARGEAFIIFEDPSRDLGAPENDPEGTCRDHTGEIEYLLTEMGYEVSRFRGPNVTCDRFLDALTDPSVLGIYYFGHGYTSGREGCLKLADGSLSAAQIEDVPSTTPFVFLNACESASAAVEPHEPPRSVAGAMAGPSHWKTVIAPVWPVVNVQAAETAKRFFRAAQQFGPLGEAMRQSRLASLQRYADGKPDLSWAAYRFFGSPGRPLPPPESGAGVRPATGTRVFDAQLHLNADVFSFAIADVLELAARRRDAEGRTQVSILDLIVGLLRRGDLLRHVLSGLVVDPDTLAENLGKGYGPSEADPGAGSPGVARGGPRHRRELEPELARLLIAADRDALQRQDGDRSLSERDLLVRLFEEAPWEAVLPADVHVGELRRRLDLLIAAGEVSDNGRVSLSGLAPRARRAIEQAHALAQQRGARPISHRLMLAGFLSDPHGHVPCACPALSTEPEQVLAIVLSAQDVSNSPTASSPHDLGLSFEMCERIVMPMLEEARRTASPWKPITDLQLFQAFCAVADTSFKAWIKELAVDLDALAGMHPPAPTLEPGEGGDRPAWMARLDPAAARIVIEAHTLAQGLGCFPITNRVLLASFLSDAQRYAVAVLSRTGPALRWEILRDRLLQRTGAATESRRFPLDEQACQAAISPVLKEALASSGDVVDERALFRAFCRVCPPSFRQALRRRSWDLDLEALASAEPQRTAAPSVQATSAIVTPVASRAPSVFPGAELPHLRLPPGFDASDLDEQVGRCMNAAARTALDRGWNEIRSPHLFASMLDEGIPVPELGVLDVGETQALRQLVLAVLPQRRLEPAQWVTASPNVAAVLDRARDRAKADRRREINFQDLLLAFFDNGGGIVGELLRTLPKRAPRALN